MWTGRNWLLVLIGIPVGLALVAGLVVVSISSRPDGDVSDDPTPPERRLVALGDSYISGEGARSFIKWTDDRHRNKCRRATTAYPVLVARQLGWGIAFAACSGARTKHVLDKPQYPRSAPGVPGAEPQVKVLRDTADPDAVLLSIGGNDAGFGEIAKGCAFPRRPDCRNRADEWVKHLDKIVYPALLKTFKVVREAARGAQVFVLTYPDPLGPKDCHVLPTNDGEFNFIKQVFLPRLNEVIRFAAAVSSVRVIDLHDSLAGKRICEVSPGRAAVNILGFRRSYGNGIDIREWAHNSFHPNERGHKLMAARVGQAMQALVEGRLEPLPPAPPASALPPFVPEEIRLPIGPYPFPRGTACRGKELASRIRVQVGMDAPKQVDIRLDDVQPSSTICMREYRGKWRSTRASADVVTTVKARVDRPGIGSINEIIYRTVEGNWVIVVVQKADSAAPE